MKLLPILGVTLVAMTAFSCGSSGNGGVASDGGFAQVDLGPSDSTGNALPFTTDKGATPSTDDPGKATPTVDDQGLAMPATDGVCSDFCGLLCSTDVVTCQAQCPVVLGAHSDCVDLMAALTQCIVRTPHSCKSGTLLVDASCATQTVAVSTCLGAPAGVTTSSGTGGASPGTTRPNLGSGGAGGR